MHLVSAERISISAGFNAVCGDSLAIDKSKWATRGKRPTIRSLRSQLRWGNSLALAAEIWQSLGSAVFRRSGCGGNRLNRYRQSGVWAAAFHAGVGVSLAAFYGWLHRLREAVGAVRGPRVAALTVREAAGDPAALFVRVAVRQPVGELQIEVSGCVVIRLPLEIDERLLRACLRAVR